MPLAASQTAYIFFFLFPIVALVVLFDTTMCQSESSYVYTEAEAKERLSVLCCCAVVCCAAALLGLG